jgi:DNA polymerase-3 subunit epsilon
VRRLLERFRPGPELDEGLRVRISQWREAPEPDPGTPLREARFVVVDVETTGPDAHRSELLSVGLVPVGPGGVELGGMEEIVLRWEHERIDKENLVVHGISPTESSAGLEPSEALTRVLERIGKHWLVAFRADFDRSVLRRSLRNRLGVSLPNPFLDAAMLLPALYPEDAAGLHSLDDWLGHFGIPAPARHRASADALVTAELLLLVLARARRVKKPDLAALAGIGRAQSRLRRMRL